MNCMWLIFMGELGNHHALYIITHAFKDMDSVFGLNIPTIVTHLKGYGYIFPLYT